MEESPKPETATPIEPKLVRRREHRKSTIKIGRTIAEAREHLETRSERAAARKTLQLLKDEPVDDPHEAQEPVLVLRDTTGRATRDEA